MKNKRAISLFSSAGIGDLGLRNNDIEVVISNELLEDRHKIYNSNFPNSKCFSGDIWSHKEEIVNYYKTTYKGEQPYMVYATPPCQGMSSNGIGRLKYEIEQGNRGKEDERNRLIIPTLDIICELKPEWVLLENVPGMKNTIIRDEQNKTVNIIEYIKHRLGNDYIGDAEVIACDDYGIPQLRKRLITIFTRKYQIPNLIMINCIMWY